VNEGGIMDLWVREARLFKYGSGTGTNFSSLRGEGEKLSGGGKSSGLMGFLKIGDRAAGAIKSGGTTRRAAKMVIVRYGSPRYRGLHQLEGDRRTEGGVTGRRIQNPRNQTERDLKAAIKAWDGADGDACLRSCKEPGPEGRDPIGEKGDDPGNLCGAHLQYARQGYSRHRIPHL
jgi:ribonucleoside-diphosphate reductase alpha chain